MNRPLFCTVFLLPVLVLAAPVLDPAAGNIPLNVHQAEKRRQSIVTEQGPDGNPMLHMKWDCSAANYLEFSLAKPVPLPEFKEGELTAEVFVPENAPVAKLNFRISDSQGETFQYMFPPQQLKPGRQVLRQQLKSVHPVSWGTKKNGRIDFPAKASGLSVDFNRKQGEGELWIGKVEFTPAPLEAGELIADAAAIPVSVGRATERRQSAGVEELDGKRLFRLNWDSAGWRWLEFSFQKATPAVDEFDSARFDVELLIPDNFKGKRLNMRLTDKNGETFQFPLSTNDLKPGWHLVPVRIDRSGAPNAGSWGGDKNRKFDFPVRLTGFSVDYPANSGAGTVAIGKIYLTR